MDQKHLDDLLFENEHTGEATSADIATFLLNDLKVKYNKALLRKVRAEIEKRFLEFYKAGKMTRYVPAD
jgi:hypothetical protein